MLRGRHFDMLVLGESGNDLAQRRRLGAMPAARNLPEVELQLPIEADLGRSLDDGNGPS
jgi:hypothetical protein